jgi:formiminotetrahydrofolate cyclodeaminase
LTARLASADPTPGGGSAAALGGAVAAALVEMVARLSLGRAELADAEPLFRQVAEAAAELRSDLLSAVDADATAYAEVVEARRLPRVTDEERAIRQVAVRAASQRATEIPLRVVHLAAEVLELAARIAPLGNVHAVSDAGVAALLASAALRGAALNVRINLPALAPDDPLRHDAPAELDRLEGTARTTSREVMTTVNGRMST